MKEIPQWRLAYLDTSISLIPIVLCTFPLSPRVSVSQILSKVTLVSPSDSLGVALLRISGTQKGKRRTGVLGQGCKREGHHLRIDPTRSGEQVYSQAVRFFRGVSGSYRTINISLWKGFVPMPGGLGASKTMGSYLRAGSLPVPTKMQVWHSAGLFLL